MFWVGVSLGTTSAESTGAEPVWILWPRTVNPQWRPHRTAYVCAPKTCASVSAYIPLAEIFRCLPYWGWGQSGRVFPERTECEWVFWDADSILFPNLFFFPSLIFIYLAVPGPSCGMQNLGCNMWDLVPWPRIEPRPSAVGGQNLNHWTTREVPCFLILLLLGIREDESSGNRFCAHIYMHGLLLYKILYKGHPWQSSNQDFMLLLLRALVQSLVGKLRFHKLWGKTKKKKKKILT